MSNWADDEDGYCTSAADFQDARRVCDELRIPLHKASFEPEYRERVFAHFLAELGLGADLAVSRVEILAQIIGDAAAVFIAD